LVPNRLSMILNLSSQANMKNARNSKLGQFNYVVFLGSRVMEDYRRWSNTIRVSMNVKKSGELEINGLPAEDINDPNIKVYSDRKETVSRDKQEDGYDSSFEEDGLDIDFEEECHEGNYEGNWHDEEYEEYEEYGGTMQNSLTGGEADEQS
jgi:hypothetical protein